MPLSDLMGLFAIPSGKARNVEDESLVFAELDLRRRELGMSMGVLAKRTGLALPTVKRILSGRHAQASWENVVAIAEALGEEVVLCATASSEDLRERQARRKAERLVKMVQGTSALETQAVDQAKLEQMIRRSVHELLAGPDRKLWEE